MGARSLFILLVLAGASYAVAQDTTNSRCRFCRIIGGPPITSITCKTNAAGNVVAVGSASCGSGTTTTTLTPTAAITQVVTYSARSRATAAAADVDDADEVAATAAGDVEAQAGNLRPIARIDFIQADGRVLSCGSNGNTRYVRSYSQPRAPNLAAVSSTGRCTASGAVRYGAIRFGWTSTPFAPTPSPSPSPKASPSPKPSPSPLPSPSPSPSLFAVQLVVTATYPLDCSAENQAAFGQQLVANMKAANPDAIVSLRYVTCAPAASGSRRLLASSSFGGAVDGVSSNSSLKTNTDNLSTSLNNGSTPIPINNTSPTSVNSSVNDIPPVQPSPSPSPSYSPVVSTFNDGL